MAKVLMLSRVFPKYHPKAGKPTDFVEQFWNSFNLTLKKYDEEFIYSSDLFDLQLFNPKLKNGFILSDFRKSLKSQVTLKSKKRYTIRKGNRFKKGDFFSPRVWSNKPYNSKQIIIDHDREVLETFEIKITKDHQIYINGIWHCAYGSGAYNDLAENDGLKPEDFKAWFNDLPFEGQIICWNQNVHLLPF